MGSTCSGQSQSLRHFHEATNSECEGHLNTDQILMKNYKNTKRFRIKQQTISTYYEGSFTLASSKEAISIKIPFFHPKYINFASNKKSNVMDELVESSLKSAESILYHPICGKLTYQGKFNQSATHLIDSFDQESDLQVHLKYEVPDEKDQNKNQKYLVKMYPYHSTKDEIFKQGIYEIYLNRSLMQNQKNTPWLHHAYSLQKEQIKTLVFVYNSYLCSLFDILQYRKETKYPYTNNEQIYIAHELIKNYRILDMNRIAHRDIRPSKIFIFDPISLQGEDEFPKNTSEQSYEFVNLESARKITNHQYKIFFENDRKLSLTPRGVPHYSSEYLQEPILNETRKYECDFQLEDRYQLANVLSALVTLNPYQNQTEIKMIRQKNKKLSFIIEKLKDIQIINIDSLFQYTTKLINKIDTIRTINCPKKLKYQLSSTPNGILTSDYDIATGLLSKSLCKKYEERYRKAQKQSMFALMQQHLYKPLLHKQIEDNYLKIEEDSEQNEQCLQNNISILHKLGLHYSKLGVQKNDYIREEINCILKLCQILRIYGYETQKHLLEANRLYRQKLSQKLKTPITKYRLVLQNSYMLLNRNQKEIALKEINKLYIPYKIQKTPLLKQFMNLPSQLKLDVYEGKIVLECENQKFETYQLYCERAIEICREEGRWKDFGRFAYLLAKYGLMEIETERSKDEGDKKIDKVVNRCQILLQQAQQLFNKERTNTNTDIILMASIIETKGDLKKFKSCRQNQKSKQKYLNKAIKNYQSSYAMLLSSKREISLAKKNGLLKKMSDLLQMGTFSYEERVWVQECMVLNLGCENLAGKVVNESEIVAESEVTQREIQMQEQKVNKLSQKLPQSYSRDQRLNDESQVFPFTTKTNLQTSKLGQSQELESQQNQEDTEFRKKKRISTRLSLLY